MKTAALGLLLCCCLSSSRAADTNHSFAVHGIGILHCETYLQEREKKSNAFFMIGGWLDGYVTATNRYAPDTYDVLSFETTELVADLLAGHCKTHPADPLFAVLNALLIKVHDDRLRARSPRIKGKAGEREFSMYAEVLQRVQRKLSELGLYQGDPEPEFGEKTREALASFQKKNNAEPTGLPDSRTLWLLLRPADVTGRPPVNG